MIMRGPKQGSEFVGRHVTYRQISRKLSPKSTEDTSVGAMFESTKSVREAGIYFGKGRRAVKKIYSGEKGRSLHFKATAKAIGVDTIKSSGVATAESIYAPGNTDSSMGSISMTVKTTASIKETGTGIRSTYKNTRKVFRYVKPVQNTPRKASSLRGSLSGTSKPAQGNMASRKAAGRAARSGIRTKRNISRRAAEISKQASRLSFVSRSAGALKAAAVNPKALLIFGIAFLVFVLFTSLTSSSGAAGAVPMNYLLADEAVVQQYIDRIKELDDAQKAEIEGYKEDGRYDDVVIEWMNEIGAVNTNWQELISIIAVEYEQDVTFSAAEQNRLVELYHKLNYIKTRTETYYCSGCESDPETGKYCPGHLRLYVQVYSLDMEEIIDDIGLEEWEKDWIRTLSASDWSEVYPGIASPSSQGELSAAEIAELMKNAPASSATREQIRETALSIVGRVGYFWGGKSSAGWNSQWGKSVRVSAPGSSTTGTYQPYGLDCSGYTDWVYKTAGVGNILSGGGSGYQWSQSYTISKSDLQVGDLVFKLKPGTSGTNHVGIYVGRDDNGNYLYCHCAYGQGVVVNSYKGFKYFRRPYINFGD